MMLPEHRSGLQRYAARKQWEADHRRPVMDEQRQEELQQVLEQALLNGQALKLTVLNERGFTGCTAIPLRIEPSTGLIYFCTGASRHLAVRAAEIVHLEPGQPGPG